MPQRRFLIWIFLALGFALASCAAPSQLRSEAPMRPITDEARRELLDARDTAWRSFFQNDASVVEGVLGHELIAIQQHAERWEDRARLLAMAKAMREQRVELVRLEFPRTEIQMFGEVAILYYTYIFEMRANGRSAVDSGRGTEVFVRRGGRWVDVGWHLDNGPFVFRDGAWARVGAPVPATSAPSSAPP